MHPTWWLFQCQRNQSSVHYIFSGRKRAWARTPLLGKTSLPPWTFQVWKLSLQHKKRNLLPSSKPRVEESKVNGTVFRKSFQITLGTAHSFSMLACKRPSNAKCTRKVLGFLNAWNRQMHRSPCLFIPPQWNYMGSCVERMTSESFGKNWCSLMLWIRSMPKRAWLRVQTMAISHLHAKC